MKDWYYFWGKLSLAVCINSNHNYFNLNLNINILIDIICMTQPDFWKSQFQCTKGFESLHTNLIFVIPLSLQPDDLNLWYFKLTLLYLTVFIVWNVNGLQHWVAAILKLENQSLWQKLNSFTNWKRSNCRKTRMLWHGRPNGCGVWLPEDKKANLWHERGKCCGLWPFAFPRSFWTHYLYDTLIRTHHLARAIEATLFVTHIEDAQSVTYICT